MPPRQDIAPLTGVRFLAAMAVVAHHLKDPLTVLGLPATIAYWIEHGGLAVPFFFVLSGFILSHVYFPAYRLADHGRFMWLRFARLWPVHLVTLGAMVLYVAGLTAVRGYVPSPKYEFTVLPAELAMVRSWYDPRFMWNGAAWSIQAEWFAYLFLFPLCAWGVRRVKNPWAVGCLIAAAVAASRYAHLTLPGHIHRILFPFIIGSLAYQLRHLLPDMRHGALVTILGVIASAIAIPLEKLSLIYLAFAVLIYGLSYDRGWIARLLSTRAMVHGGEISFSLYMVHGVVNIWTWELWEKTGATGWWPVIVTLTASLVAAHLLWRLVEVPANQWLRRRGPNRPG